MNHATPEELHDHAYGFRSSAHVAACAECRRSADAITAERETLKDALREDPMEAPADLLITIQQSRTRRPRFGAPALAAATLLLGALAWMLFQPKMPPESPRAPSSTSTHEEDIEKIFEQLKSGSPLRQELARMALVKYGAIAVPALERAKADPVLIEECRGFGKKDQEVYRKAQSTRLTVAWENAPLTDVIDHLREAGGLNFQISGVTNPDAIRVTLKAQNASVVEILDLLKELTKLPWGRTREYAQPNAPSARPPGYEPVYLFGVESPAPPSLAPVRVQSIRGWAAEQLKMPPDQRSATDDAMLISRLAQAADPSLWNYLDSPKPEVRRRAEASLRKLYGPPTVEPPFPMEVRLAASIIDEINFENQPAGELFLDLGFHEGVALILDPRVKIPEALSTMKTKSLSLRNNLILTLSQENLSSAMFGGTLIITKPEWLPLRNPSGRPLWTSPEESLEAEAIIDDLASEDAARQDQARSAARKVGRSGLAWIWHGRYAADSKSTPRFSATLDALATEMGVLLAEPTGGAYQQDLTPAQLGILSQPLSIKSRGKTLDALLKGKGIRIRFQAPMAIPLLVSSPNIRVDSLLVGLTQPLGLDFYMDADTIVIDTQKNVRAAVEKK